MAKSHEEQRRDAFRVGLRLAEQFPGVPYDELHIPEDSEAGRLERKIRRVSSEAFADLLLAALEDGYIIGQERIAKRA